MSLELVMESLFEGLFDTVGSPEVGVLCIMLILFLGMLYCGLEFDYSLVLLFPIPYAFFKGGLIDVWVASIFIIIPLGIGIWSIYNKLSIKQ